MPRFEKREIHKVFLRFPNLALTKNLSANLLAELCAAASNALSAPHGQEKKNSPPQEDVSCGGYRLSIA